MVDLDSNKLSPPTGMAEEIPALPEPEGTILKNHLKQVSSIPIWLNVISVIVNSMSNFVDSDVNSSKIKRTADYFQFEHSFLFQIDLNHLN